MSSGGDSPYPLGRRFTQDTARNSTKITFTVRFEKPGTYNYVYTVHPWMTGKVKVVMMQ
jgi:plastocyanin